MCLQDATVSDRVRSCQELHAQADDLLPADSVVWLRVRQVLVDALHRKASAGAASEEDLIELLQVCVCFSAPSMFLRQVECNVAGCCAEADCSTIDD